MVIFTYIILALSVGFALLSGYANLKNKALLRITFKVVASTLFVVAGILNIQKMQSLTGNLILIALLLGLIGDVFLTINNKILKQGEQAIFTLGGIFFLVGHLAYIVAFTISISQFNYYLLFLIVLLPVVIFGLTKLTTFSSKTIMKLMPIYFLIISIMTASVLNYYLINQTTSAALALSAAVLFVLSDTALIFKNFSVKFKDSSVLVYFVLLSYYVAQALFVLTIMYN